MKNDERYRPIRPNPVPISLPPSKTILVIVDMQNDYCQPQKESFVDPSILSTIPRIQKLLHMARRSKVTVIHTQQASPLDEKCIATHPRVREMSPEHINGAVRGTSGAEIISELAPLPNEIVLPKGSSDPWFDHTFDKQLLHLGFNTFDYESAFHNRVSNDCYMIVVGTESDWCVDKAVIGAYLRGFQVVVPMDSISAPTAFRQDSAIQRFHEQYLATMTTAEDIAFI